jgi:hypothetical protein
MLSFGNGNGSMKIDLCYSNRTSNFRTYRIVVNERGSITDISIHYPANTSSIIKLGYLSVRQEVEI